MQDWNMQIEKSFSKREMIGLLELIHRATLCTNEDNFRSIIESIRNFLQFEHSLTAMCEMDGVLVKSFNAVNINYPAEWGEHYVIKRWDKVDPVCLHNFTNFDLFHWSDDFLLQALPNNYVSISYDFGLRSGYTSGIQNSKGNGGSIFTFSGKKVKKDKKVESVLPFIIPHLHQALRRILKQGKEKNVVLSMREAEILKWLRHGKSTWDISVILNISERTVKFHIFNLMQKLDASNRAHAVAIAIEQKLIAIE